ncbi:hypothetical protein MHYP_G00328760 [Metynnis hypsauchen]
MSGAKDLRVCALVHGLGGLARPLIPSSGESSALPVPLVERAVVIWETAHGVGQHRGTTMGTIILTRELLISLRASTNGVVPVSIPTELCRSVFKKNRRKRGRRGGIRHRLRSMDLSDRRKLPALPTVILSNMQSIRNKIDELEAWAKLRHEGKGVCLLAFTETWLSELDRDEELLISGFSSPFRLDRSPEITNKHRGGGVCFYVNQRYCNTVVVRERMCTSDIELLTISLRPHYLPHEFQQAFFTLV